MCLSVNCAPRNCSKVSVGLVSFLCNLHMDSTVETLDRNVQCVLSLDQYIAEHDFVKWAVATLGWRDPGEQLYTRIYKTTMLSLHCHFAASNLPHVPALPPQHANTDAMLVYCPKRVWRIYPYVGEIPYARVPSDCTLGQLLEIRQSIYCGEIDPQDYGRISDHIGNVASYGGHMGGSDSSGDHDDADDVMEDVPTSEAKQAFENCMHRLNQTQEMGANPISTLGGADALAFGQIRPNKRSVTNDGAFCTGTAGRKRKRM